MMKLWIWGLIRFRHSGSSTFSSHFQLFEPFSLKGWVLSDNVPLPPTDEVGRHWPIETVNVIKYRRSAFIQYSTVAVVLIATFSVYSTRNECQYGAKEPQEQPLKLPHQCGRKKNVLPPNDEINPLTRLKSLNCPMAPWSQLRYQCWVAVDRQHYRWLHIFKEVNESQTQRYGTGHSGQYCRGHIWSNFSAKMGNRKMENGKHWTTLSFLLWDMSNNASRWCWLPTSQSLGPLHVKCIYIL